jgi:protein-disulfide isomerase
MTLRERRNGRAITLVQYGGYECPYTRLSRRSIQQLQRACPVSPRFVFRPFPLEEIHPHARAAYLFEHQQALEEVDLKRYAVELGLDSDRFARDRASPQVEVRIERDLASGDRSGVPGTPTFYVNGLRHEGGYDLESLRSAILAHIDGRAEAHSTAA